MPIEVYLKKNIPYLQTLIQNSDVSCKQFSGELLEGLRGAAAMWLAFGNAIMQAQVEKQKLE